MATILAAKLAVSRVPDRRSRALALSAMIATYLFTVPFLGPYYDHYRLKDSPFAWNTPAVEPPALFQKTEIRRPGVRSIADAYFTFRLIDLIRDPILRRRNYGERYRENRTSLWTQLYARAHYAQFAAWPPSWRSVDPAVMNTARAAFALGLLPLAFFLLGGSLEARRLVQGLRERGPPWLDEDHRWVLLALAGGMLFLVVKFSYDLRDFSSMKAIYIYPGLAALVPLLLTGWTRLDSWIGERSGLRIAISAWIAMLAGVYCLDIVWLIEQLWHYPA